MKKNGHIYTYGTLLSNVMQTLPNVTSHCQTNKLLKQMSFLIWDCPQKGTLARMLEGLTHRAHRVPNVPIKPHRVPYGPIGSLFEILSFLPEVEILETHIQNMILCMISLLIQLDMSRIVNITELIFVKHATNLVYIIYKWHARPGSNNKNYVG
mgnify:CR=1 FL=1